LAIHDIFSKRQKKLKGEVPDVYTYDNFPPEFLIQVIHILKDALGNSNDYENHSQVEDSYKFIVDALCREYGVFRLPRTKSLGRNYYKELIEFFYSEPDIERVIDVIELSFRVIDRGTRDNTYLYRENASEKVDAAIDELNSRMKEHGIGYQFTNGEIIRIDSELMHSEVVKPALRLLSQKQYSGAQQEFLKAHEHYRNGNAKEALNEALKAFESVMKAICDKRGWKYDKDAPAKELIKTCFDQGLIPPFWEQHYAALRSLLESSVPTGRNKLSGHGQGTTLVEVPNYLVAYMLHMTASVIVFLGEAEKELP
jgi:hypothetical protein